MYMCNRPGMWKMSKKTKQNKKTVRKRCQSVEKLVVAFQNEQSWVLFCLLFSVMALASKYK